MGEILGSGMFILFTQFDPISREFDPILREFDPI